MRFLDGSWPPACDRRIRTVVEQAASELNVILLTMWKSMTVGFERSSSMLHQNSMLFLLRWKSVTVGFERSSSMLHQNSMLLVTSKEIWIDHERQCYSAYYAEEYGKWRNVCCSRRSTWLAGYGNDRTYRTYCTAVFYKFFRGMFSSLSVRSFRDGAVQPLDRYFTKTVIAVISGNTPRLSFHHLRSYTSIEFSVAPLDWIFASHDDSPAASCDQFPTCSIRARYHRTTRLGMEQGRGYSVTDAPQLASDVAHCSCQASLPLSATMGSGNLSG